MQGPPGAGKTHTGARMICALAREGKTVGITANSHKVIRNLLDEVVVAAREQAFQIGCIQKISDKEDDRPSLKFTTDNAAFLDALGSDCQIGGGTAWFWARPDASESVDVLFIDEAAQMSLANVLAVSQAAQSIVLLGDPRQLEQPIQGSHPEGVDVSSLDHNRLNVATSRAKCICVVVASPRLFEVECRTPRQMQLANAFCRYLELATPL